MSTAIDVTSIERPWYFDHHQGRDLVWKDNAWWAVGYESANILLRENRLEARATVPQSVNRLSRNHREAIESFQQFLNLWMAFSGGQTHQAMRHATAPLSGQKSVLLLREQIARHAQSLWRKVSPGDNLVDVYSRPLAEYAVKLMMGVPDEDLLPEAAAILSLLGSDGGTQDQVEEALAAIHSMLRKVKNHERTSHFLRFVAEVDRSAGANGYLTAATVAQFATGGVGPLTLCISALLAHGAPTGQRAQHYAEIQRLYPAFHTAPRVVMRCFDFMGHHLHTGDVVKITLAAANIDTRVFPQGRLFSPRASSLQNISFGRGLHRCLGAPLTATVLDVITSLGHASQPFEISRGISYSQYRTEIHHLHHPRKAQVDGVV